MGTSINHGSPRTTHWKAVHVMYQDSRFPTDRVLREVWRAAGELQEQLKDPRIGRILDVALTKSDASQVSYAVAREASKLGSPSLALELARRAAVQTVAAPDRTGAFVQQIFSEASNYIVSRDLPGSIGLGNRNADVAQGAKFKDELVERTKSAVKSATTPKGIHPEADWTETAKRVIKRLAEQRE